jgi:DNA-binding beta-propeller fold protein YncE
VDPDSAEITAHYPTASIPSGIAITDDEVWVADSLGSVTRIDPEAQDPLAALELEGDPSWFAVGPDSVLLASSNAGTAAVLDKSTGEILGSVDRGDVLRDPGFVGGNFWVTLEASNTVGVVSPRSGELIGKFAVPDVQAIWTAEGLIGDGWVLDYGGTKVVRLEPTSGL